MNVSIIGNQFYGLWMVGAMRDCEGDRRHLPALFPVSGLLGFIRFDAADVVWSTFHQCAHQIVGLFLKDGVRELMMRLMIIMMSNPKCCD